MGIFIDPEWEYSVVDPEIEEAVYGNHVSRSALDTVIDGRLAFGGKYNNQGMRFGHGNSNNFEGRLAPLKPGLTEEVTPNGLAPTPKHRSSNYTNCLVCSKEYGLWPSSTECKRQGFCTVKCRHKRQLQIVKILYIDGITIDEIGKCVRLSRQAVDKMLGQIPGLVRRPVAWHPERDRLKRTFTQPVSEEELLDYKSHPRTHRVAK